MGKYDYTTGRGPHLPRTPPSVRYLWALPLTPKEHLMRYIPRDRPFWPFGVYYTVCFYAAFIAGTMTHCLHLEQFWLKNPGAKRHLAVHYPFYFGDVIRSREEMKGKGLGVLAKRIAAVEDDQDT